MSGESGEAKKMLRRDSLSAYIREIYLKSKLLRSEEEKHYGKLAFDGDSEACEKMIVSNLRLVISIAKFFQGRGLSFADLIQEGNIGLMIAVKRFRADMGFRFSTYASWWIRQSIGRAISNHGDMIRIPINMERDLKAIKRLSKELGHEPNVEDIAKNLCISRRKAKRLKDSQVRVCSFDTPLGEDGSATLKDLVADYETDSPFTCLEDKERQALIQRCLKKLNSRERRILERRFLNEECTLDEVGQELGLTRERIRQVQVEALKKLKNGPEGCALRTLWQEL